MIWLAILWVCDYIRNKPLLMISLIVMLCAWPFTLFIWVILMAA